MAQTERDFQRQVIGFAKLRGWLVAHFRPARTASGGWRTPVQADGAGFPDLLMVHPARGVLLAVELKVGRNAATDAQVRWLEAFRAAGVRAEVWTPDQWPQIEEALTV